MSDKDKVVEAIKQLIRGYFKGNPGASQYKVPLMSRLYDEQEVAEVVETLLAPERLTINASGDLKTEKFENKWAKFIGAKNGIMVNSGSSANLVVFYILSNPLIPNRLKPGDEVITAALTYGTSITPLYAQGLMPVFVDVNAGDYTMDVNQIEAAITPKTRAILVVHLLGFPCDMGAITEIAKRHNLYVIEDCCEAHGAEWKGQKIGSFGDLSTFSFYLSHHITTIEGGMVMTGDDNYAELARIIRSQGVMRNVKSQAYKQKINSEYPDIDPRFLFANVGYNFRPTELQGSFGLVQFEKFGRYFTKRESVVSFFTNEFRQYRDFLVLPKLKTDAKPAWFGYPITVKKPAPFTREDLVSFLESKGIETRPIMAGNFTKQPVAQLYDFRVSGSLANADYVHSNSFFIGVHAGIDEEKMNYVADTFKEFFNKYKLQ